MRNQDARLGAAIAAYFLFDPAAFLAAAETIWSGNVDDAWGEDVLKGAVERFASAEAVPPCANNL